MSDTRKINEGVVTSIVDTDLVMCSGSGGSYTPISFANLAKLIRSTINAGGRNLALGTSEGPTVVAGNTKQFRLSETLSIGEEVSVSFELDHPSPQPYFEVYISPLNGGSVSQRHMIQRQILSNGLNKLTFTLTKVGERIAFYTQAGVSISVSKVMVTRGNMFSDWAPAPEDSWGGVIAYHSISCNLNASKSQEGGRHDRYSEAIRIPLGEVCGRPQVYGIVLDRRDQTSGEGAGSRMDGFRDRCERMHIVGHLGAYVICGQHSFRNVPEHTRMSSVQLESDPYSGYVHAQRIRRKGPAEIYGQRYLERLEGVFYDIARKEVAA